MILIQDFLSQLPVAFQISGHLSIIWKHKWCSLLNVSWKFDTSCCFSPDHIRCKLESWNCNNLGVCLHGCLAFIIVTQPYCSRSGSESGRGDHICSDEMKRHEVSLRARGFLSACAFTCVPLSWLRICGSSALLCISIVNSSSGM